MRDGNSNWANNRTNYTQGTPSGYSTQNIITTPPQNISRSLGPMTLGGLEEGSRTLRSNLSNVISGLSPLMHHTRNAETHGHSIRSWLRRSNHPDQNIRTNTSESTVINFDNIQEPSTSYSRSLNEVNVNTTVLDQCQIDFSSLELGGGSEPQNFVNHNQEHNSIATQNNINGNSNNNSNNSVTQTNEGTQAENSNSTPTPEGQSIDKLFNRFIPFITFLLMKAIYDHREGILIFIGLLVTFTHANAVVKREIAKQSRRSLLSLGILFVNLFVCICFIYFVFKEQRLYKNLILIPSYSQPLTIWDLLWMVGITDFVLKFITIQLKVGMACFPAKLIPYSARGKWYLMLECFSQLYRGLVPIQPWLYYLMEAYQGPQNAVGVFFSLAYMVSKGSDLMSKVKLFLKAFWKLVQNANLGVRPSKEQLNTAGSQCPICHDEYNSPIILLCRHVFCEACVTTWFDREQTCPLCRAKVADDPSWRDGATSFFTQLF